MHILEKLANVIFLKKLTVICLFRDSEVYRILSKELHDDCESQPDEIVWSAYFNLSDTNQGAAGHTFHRHRTTPPER